MKNRRAVILLSGALALLPSGATGVPFTAQGTIRLEVSGLPPVIAPIAGSAMVNGAAPAGGAITSLALTGNAFTTTGLLVDVTDPGASPIGGQLLSASAGAAGFSGSPLAGTLPLAGIFKLCIFTGCSAPSVPANVSVPLSVVGIGGTTTATGFVNITVVGAPWTSGTVNIGLSTRAGFVHGPLSATSSAASLGGAARLVTPVFIALNQPSSPVLTTFATLDLVFVPEPTTAVLLGVGVAALAGRGRRLARRQDTARRAG